jgi:hypothetical protein
MMTSFLSGCQYNDDQSRFDKSLSQKDIQCPAVTPGIQAEAIQLLPQILIGNASPSTHEHYPDKLEDALMK